MHILPFTHSLKSSLGATDPIPSNTMTPTPLPHLPRLTCCAEGDVQGSEGVKECGKVFLSLTVRVDSRQGIFDVTG